MSNTRLANVKNMNKKVDSTRKVIDKKQLYEQSD